MRQPNFLSTVANRASLAITQTLYDRRALDCTSSRPLVQSLQELVQLTNSSSKVRETLCEDGGLERLVQLIKEAQNPKDPLSPYKWHLCMQCFLNLGARGSQEIRTRVIESGVIPVLATILDNYLVVHGDLLEKRDKRNVRERQASKQAQSLNQRASTSDVDSINSQNSSRSSSVSNLVPQPVATRTEEPVVAPVAPGGSDVTLATTEGPTDSTDSTGPTGPTGPTGSTDSTGPTGTETPAAPASSVAVEAPDRIAPPFTDIVDAISRVRDDLYNHQPDVNDNANWDTDTNELGTYLNRNILAAFTGLTRESVRASVQPQLRNRNQNRDQNENQVANGNGNANANDVDSTVLLNIRPSASRLSDLTTNGTNLPKFSGSKIVPRELDVCWALEIIAYLSKHTFGRKIMQETCLLNTLSLRPEKQVIDYNLRNPEDIITFDLSKEKTLPMDTWEMMYYSYNFMNKADVCPDYGAFRIKLFELVEKYTAFKFPREFPHWSYFIMRNFIRKDENGVRQCANFNCGKWEDFPKQFAKCRRCRRTKYCSKACQLESWTMHRFWCTVSSVSSSHHNQSQGQTQPQNQPQRQNQLQRQNQPQGNGQPHTHNQNETRTDELPRDREHRHQVRNEGNGRPNVPNPIPDPTSRPGVISNPFTGHITGPTTGPITGPITGPLLGMRPINTIGTQGTRGTDTQGTNGPPETLVPAFVPDPSSATGSATGSAPGSVPGAAEHALQHNRSRVSDIIAREIVDADSEMTGSRQEDVETNVEDSLVQRHALIRSFADDFLNFVSNGTQPLPSTEGDSNEPPVTDIDLTVIQDRIRPTPNINRVEQPDQPDQHDQQDQQDQTDVSDLMITNDEDNSNENDDEDTGTEASTDVSRHNSFVFSGL